MSAPVSGSRPSLSSEKSAASSHTLISRHSGTHEGNGEGSSSQRPNVVSRHSSGMRDSTSDPPSSEPTAHLAAEYIEEQDFAHRKYRNRRSGGFLLDSTFPSGPRTRQPAHAPTEDVKVKRGSYHNYGTDGSGYRGRVRTGHGAPNHSPLSHEVVLADQGAAERKSGVDSAGIQEHTSGDIHIARTRKSENSATIPEDIPPASRAAIDPNQIVHMALNLSESRRRNLNAGQLLAPQAPGARRVTSTGLQDGSFRNYGTGSSLRQYLNEQRRNSRNISPAGGNISPSRSHHISTHHPRSVSFSMQTSQHTFSEATIARRNKARAYIELRIEYLRLLEFLPPLKPDSSAPGNYTISANNMPGSPHAQITRTPSHVNSKYELGREYNPIQYIRNRRNRARERKSLDHTPEEFLDIDSVRDWVDRVQWASQRPGYRQQDGVVLPKYHEDHSREDVSTKPTRHRMGWAFTSEELLADALWVEQGDNKSTLDDRYGRKIFPPKEPQTQELQLPRGSKEYLEKRSGSWVEGLQRISTEITMGDESEPISERGRKRRLLPAFRAESPKHRKHGWRGSRPRSGNFSDFSDSDTGSQKHRSRKSRGFIDSNSNTGPLELKIKQMMEKEAQEAEANTPGTPAKWGHPSLPNGKPTRTSMEVAGIESDSLEKHDHLGLKSPPKDRHSKLGLTLEFSQGEPRPSLDDLDSSTTPNTPLHPKYLSHIGTDSSPTHSREGSIPRHSKKSKLGVFRSDESTKESKHDQKHESDLSGTERKRDSRNISDEMGDKNGLGTAILTAPSAVKSLLVHKKNDSVSSLPNPETYRKDTREMKEPKEPSSAVTRFFKGVKSEGSKVSEFIFKRDRPMDDSDSETHSSHLSASESETDEPSEKPGRRFRPSFARSTTATTTGSVASKKPSRHYVDLPSFRSSQANDEDTAYTTDSQLTDHHITRQARATAKNRSPRFDKLAPPRMDLRELSSTSTSHSLHVRSHSPGRDRINRILARAGGVGQGGLPVTSLANAQFSGSANRQSSTTRPGLEKRHWSITDENGTVLHRTVNAITPADIARIRALFFCSGVKAQEIARRASTRRQNPAAFLVRAAQATNTQPIPIPKKEEHVLAARMLTRNLESSTQALHESAKNFRESTVKGLVSMMTDLKSRVESDLVPRVRSSGDEAVRITNQISGSAPLEVKQITDEIENMLRMRRRRMKWVRRVGWMLVEWMLVGLMWWLWLCVVVLGFVRRVIGWNLRFARWLLWL